MRRTVADATLAHLLGGAARRCTDVPPLRLASSHSCWSRRSPPFALPAAVVTMTSPPTTMLAETFGAGQADQERQARRQGATSTSRASRASPGPIDAAAQRAVPELGQGPAARTSTSRPASTAGGQSLQIGAVSTGREGLREAPGHRVRHRRRALRVVQEGLRGRPEAGGHRDQGRARPSRPSASSRCAGCATPRRPARRTSAAPRPIKITARVDVKTFIDDVSTLLDKAKGLQIQGAGEVPGGLSAKQQAQVVRSIKSANDRRLDRQGRQDAAPHPRSRSTSTCPADARKDVGGLRAAARSTSACRSATSTRRRRSPRRRTRGR